MKRLTALFILLFLAHAAFGYTTLIVQDDDTDVSLFFYAVTSDGDPNATPVLTDYDLYYCKMGAAMAAKVDITALAAADTAHTDNKAFHVGQGVVRVDVPDAAFAGAPGDLVVIRLVDVSGAAAAAGEDKFEPVYVQLTPAVQTHAMSTAYEALLGTTAEIASAANDAIVAGTVGTGVSTIETQIGTAGAGLTALPDTTGIETAVTNSLTAYAPATATALATAQADLDNPSQYKATGFSTHSAADVITAMGTGTFLTAVPWNADWDDEVESEATDALTAYGPATAATAATAVLAKDIDGQSVQSVLEALLSFMAGKIAVTDSATTRTYTYYLQNGTTVKMVVTAAKPLGNRTATGTVTE